LNRLFVIPHLLWNPNEIRKMTDENPESSIENTINILQAAHWPRTDARKMSPFSYVFSLSCFIGGTAILAVISRAGSPCHIRKLLIQLSG